MKNNILVILLLFILGCNNKDPQPAVFEAPSSVTLIFPFENSECNEGTDITDTKTTVLFEWFASEFTDEYDLNVTNLVNGEMFTITTTGLKIPVILQRATPYAWSVISKNDNTDSTAQSNTWKFYNAGEGVVSYAPFPAEIIAPEMAGSINASDGNVALSWLGADVDNDIKGYDIYFGKAIAPPLIAENETVATFEVSVENGQIYYWRIVTKDEAGHSSNSGIFQFKVL